MYSRIRSAGKVVYLHTAAHVEPIVGELVDMGVTMLQPIQPESMDIFALKRRLRPPTLLRWGISTSGPCPSGLPEQVSAEVRRCIEVIGEGGGYVIARPSRFCPACLWPTPWP